MDLRKDTLYDARSRAKKANVPFDLTFEDIVIPAVRPYLRIPLIAGHKEGDKRCGPTLLLMLDKIIPELGYVKGNVQVISMKANWMMNNSKFEAFELMFENWKSRRAVVPQGTQRQSQVGHGQRLLERRVPTDSVQR